MLRLPMVIGVRTWVSAISASLRASSASHGSLEAPCVPPRHSSAHGPFGQRKSGDKIPPELIVELLPGQPINELARPGPLGERDVPRSVPCARGGGGNRTRN